MAYEVLVVGLGNQSLTPGGAEHRCRDGARITWERPKDELPSKWLILRTIGEDELGRRVRAIEPPVDKTIISGPSAEQLEAVKIVVEAFEDAKADYWTRDGKPMVDEVREGVSSLLPTGSAPTTWITREVIEKATQRTRSE
jgi:hypothetical protein